MKLTPHMSPAEYFWDYGMTSAPVFSAAMITATSNRMSVHLILPEQLKFVNILVSAVSKSNKLFFARNYCVRNQIIQCFAGVNAV